VVAGQLGQGIENAWVVNQLSEKARLVADLQVAAGIQGSLLPGRPPLLPGAGLAAACLPAAQVGGDYYDFLPDADGAVTILVADVAGHGLGPGLIMVMARSVLRAELRHSASLAAALQATDSVMWDDLVATETFITVFVTRYQPDTRMLQFANAGHQPALLRHADGSVEELTGDGLPLGILTSAPYELCRRQLAVGDAVLIFSDGVVEASAPDGAPYGIGRLKALLGKYGNGPPADVVAKVLADVADFQEGSTQDDDMTVVVLDVAGAGPVTWSA
jgi:sigma-B regulation protein RsbU (phosphoserine phosphatase)